MKVVALLPMKANSERVKGKNFRDFGGKPLYRWMLDTLLSIAEIDLIVINTDARAILASDGLTESERIKIRDRREDICGDMVSMNLIIADDIDNIEADIFLMTHTTNPLLSRVSVKAAISDFKNAVRDRRADSLFTVNKVQDRFYDGNVQPINHDLNNLIRTQDLEPWYQENSNLYLFTKESFLRTQTRIGSNPMMLETEPYESTDIDTPSDWDLGEVMVDYYRKKGVLECP
ncbi:acylneuraminate cytidylyltransferase family protein [Gammaproteobacteria bacterium]|nr:acylneuraminate cytidylyltransferase family protein [Gammaproteobacteria bacterium]